MTSGENLCISLELRGRRENPATRPGCFLQFPQVLLGPSAPVGSLLGSKELQGLLDLRGFYYKGYLLIS